jgi:hypothetical protein
MDLPYHVELHNILISKGFNYRRYNYLFGTKCDHYMDNDGRAIVFYEDESIKTYGLDGMPMPIEYFDELTNNIFHTS